MNINDFVFARVEGRIRIRVYNPVYWRTRDRIWGWDNVVDRVDACLSVRARHRVLEEINR